MDTLPLISVIIPAHNDEAYLAEAIASVLSQKYSNFEIIVVDDSSTDGTRAVAETFGDAIRIISFEKNRGPSAARNAGMRNAGGSIIGFLDADDLWTDSALACMAPALQSDEYDFVRGLTKFFRNREDGSREFEERVRTEIVMSTTLYKKSFLDRVGVFDESMRFGEDLDWNIRLFENGGREKKINEVVLLCRRHAGNTVHQEELSRRGMMEAFRKKFIRSRAK